jgi:hypothetical protein
VSVYLCGVCPFGVECVLRRVWCESGQVWLGRLGPFALSPRNRIRSTVPYKMHKQCSLKLQFL